MAETKISLENGKYTVRHDNGANLRAERYGEPWRSLTGDGLVLALAQRVEDLELALRTLKDADGISERRAAVKNAGDLLR